MANEEHLKILKQSVEQWNKWRLENAIKPDLGGANLSDVNLCGANLSGANLGGASLGSASMGSANLSDAKMLDVNLSYADLSDADLSKADLGCADLRRADLSGANLRRANLWGANLRHANLPGANLIWANLSGADLSKADLGRANLGCANLSGANLGGANLACADLSGANLSGANLGRANLIDAKLSDADLSNAKLFDANLSDADLSKANLSNAKLRGAILADVDLQGANLTSADLTDADLSRTGLVETDFTNATITGCRTYGASAWNVTLAGTVQNNLVITKEGEPVVTVDDLEVAQFIHLLITNRKIRNVIHSVTSKAVLILGRFSEKQKPVLDALHTALRDSHNLVPILFDWEPSENRDLTETVLLLANMCRFVIADVTDAKSIPQELSVIVPNLPSVAVQPIILASEHEYAMFEHWRKFPAVLSEYRYESQQQLLDTLDTRVLAPIKQWEEATDKTAVKERQMREEIEAQRAEIAKLKRQAAEGGR